MFWPHFGCEKSSGEEIKRTEKTEGYLKCYNNQKVCKIIKISELPEDQQKVQEILKKLKAELYSSNQPKKQSQSPFHYQREKKTIKNQQVLNNPKTSNKNKSDQSQKSQNHSEPNKQMTNNEIVHDFRSPNKRKKSL